MTGLGPRGKRTPRFCSSCVGVPVCVSSFPPDDLQGRGEGNDTTEYAKEKKIFAVEGPYANSESTIPIFPYE